MKKITILIISTIFAINLYCQPIPDLPQATTSIATDKLIIDQADATRYIERDDLLDDFQPKSEFLDSMYSKGGVIKDSVNILTEYNEFEDSVHVKERLFVGADFTDQNGTVNVLQIEDDRGIYVFGYDDEINRNGRFLVSSNGDIKLSFNNFSAILSQFFHDVSAHDFIISNEEVGNDYDIRFRTNSTDRLNVKGTGKILISDLEDSGVNTNLVGVDENGELEKRITNDISGIRFERISLDSILVIDATNNDTILIHHDGDTAIISINGTPLRIDSEFVVSEESYFRDTSYHDKPIYIEGNLFNGTGIGSAAAGNTGEVQFNTSNVFDSEPSFFWDKPNDRLGLGINVPLSTLHINGGTGSLATGLIIGNSTTGIYMSSSNELTVDLGGVESFKFTQDTIFTPNAKIEGSVIVDTAKVDILIYSGLPHMNMNFSDSTVNLDLILNTEVVVTNSNDSIYRKNKFDGGFSYASDTVLFPTHINGDYIGGGHLSFIGGATAANYEIKIHCNGSVFGSYYGNTANNTGTITVSFPDLSFDDAISDSLYITVTNLTNSNDITLIGGGLVLTAVHLGQ
jgi:hypothetical protein